MRISLDIVLRSRIHEIDNDWKPSFLFNEEFTHILLEVSIVMLGFYHQLIVKCYVIEF